MNNIITLPGLIDPHVHLRTPGQEQKEDFLSGTTAALAGGYTTIIDMPNNTQLIQTEHLLDEKIALAKQQAVCNIGFHFGSLGDNLDQFEKVASKVIGLKLYLSQTTGGFILPKEKVPQVFEAWPKEKVILVHAEDEMLPLVLDQAKRFGNRIHVCHVGQQNEIAQIMKAKDMGTSVTCGVTPHYLFLTQETAAHLGWYGKMKPPLGTKADQDFLWSHLDAIDIVESDHAPHTKKEKESANPPFGVPGLETTLPLLLTALHEERITLEEIRRLCYEGPSHIFSISQDPQTKINIDMSISWKVDNDLLHTKCGWSPFHGWMMQGKVTAVYLAGTKVFANDTLLAKQGSGSIIT